MDGGAWLAAVHGVIKSRIRLSDFTFTFHFHALEKEMATHSSVLAWRIPGTGEPGGLSSMGSHRVGHNWSDLAAAAAAVYIYHCYSLNSSHPLLAPICPQKLIFTTILFGAVGFPGGSMVKNPSANAGNVGLIPGLGRSPGEGNGNPLQYSCWGNLMDRGAWQAAVHGVTEELDTTQWLNNNNLEQQSEHCAKWKRSLNLKTCESRSLWCILGWSLGNASANLLNESGKCPD